MNNISIQELLHRELMALDWKSTGHPNVVIRNNCTLYLGPVTNLAYKKSFKYSQDEIKMLIDNDFNFCNINLSESRVYSPIVQLNNVDFYMEKYGWLITSGKYNKVLPSFDGYSCSDDELLSFLTNVTDLADKDHVQMKAVKQRLQNRVKIETQFVGKPTGNSITEDCFIEVLNDSKLDSLFRQGDLFKVSLLSNEFVIVTAVNKKGALTNKNYQVDSEIFVQEAMSKNIRAVDIVPKTIEVPYCNWEVFGSNDLDINIPEEIKYLISSDKQQEFIYKAISSNYNITPLLNKNASEESYNIILDLCALNYLPKELLFKRLRESTAKILAQQVSIGYDPVRFIDDSLDSYELELEIQNALNEIEAYKAQLSKLDLNSKVTDLLCKYYFRTGQKLNSAVSNNTRWQYLLPYYYDCDLTNDSKEELVNIIKSYGILTDDGCILKSVFFTNELKGWLLRYFRSPIDFEFQGKNWNELLQVILNNSVLINLDEHGIGIRYNDRLIVRDLNSLVITDLFYQPKWRCVFINEKAICFGNNNDISL